MALLLIWIVDFPMLLGWLVGNADFFFVFTISTSNFVLKLQEYYGLFMLIQNIFEV